MLSTSKQVSRGQRTSRALDSVANAAEAASRCLQQGEVSTVEHCFRLSDSLDFAGACLLTHIVVLQQPITFGMQRAEDFVVCHVLLQFFVFGVFVRLQGLLSIGLCSLLVRDLLL